MVFHMVLCMVFHKVYGKVDVPLVHEVQTFQSDVPLDPLVVVPLVDVRIQGAPYVLVPLVDDRIQVVPLVLVQIRIRRVPLVVVPYVLVRIRKVPLEVYRNMVVASVGVRNEYNDGLQFLLALVVGGREGKFFPSFPFPYPFQILAFCV